MLAKPLRATPHVHVGLIVRVMAMNSIGRVAGEIARLPAGIQDWYAQPGSLAGVRRVNSTDPTIVQFSWLTRQEKATAAT